MSPLRIHFFGKQADRPVSPLAGALGLGPLPRPSGVESHRYDRLAERAHEQFACVPADSTHLWVYAHDVGDRDEVSAQLERLPSGRGHCVFFYGSDDAAPLPLNHERVTVFRTSLNSSKRLTHERVMPALCDDLMAGDASPAPKRSWMPTPTVGFCGFVGTPLRRLGFQVLRQQDKSDGLQLRERALSALEHSPALQTEFIRRDRFWAGSMGRFHYNAGRQEDVRSEFVANLKRSDYGLCVRGKGNFSYRLYEVLSAGRVPVFINSDCSMPFAEEIDWRRHTVWLEPEELPVAAERIRAFHEALGPAGLLARQRENRQLWETWFSPERYYEKALGALAKELGLC